MSRLWDTPQFWARQEADEMLREMWDEPVDALADSFEKSAASYDGGPDMAAAVLADLRRRVAAGVRFWPDSALPADLEPRENAPAQHAPPPAEAQPAPDEDLIDDDIPW